MNEEEVNKRWGNVLNYRMKRNDEERPWVILVHGLAGNLHDFEEESRRLSEKFHVLSVGLRGHGKSKAIRKHEVDYSFETAASEILAILNEYKIRKAHFIGTGLGAVVVQALANHYPKRCLSLLLVNSWVALPFRIRFVLDGAYYTRGLVPAKVWHGYLQQLTLMKKDRLDGKLYYKQQLKEMDVHSFYRWVYLLTKSPEIFLEARKKDKAIPTLFLMGAEEKIARKEAKLETEGRRGSRYEEIKETGYDVHLFYSEKFVEHAFSFLSSLKK